MSSKFINHNGNILPGDEAIFNAQNRSFRYGDGIFESMRLMNGKINFLSHHLDRLSQGMALLKMSSTLTLTESKVNTEIKKLILSNGSIDNGIVRFSMYRRDGGRYNPAVNDSSFLIEVEEHKEQKYTLNQRGITLGIFEDIKKDKNAFSNIKSNNALISIMASIHAVNNNFDDCLLLNIENILIETTSSNLFIEIDNHIYTPPLSSGCVSGVMRKVVFELCEENEINISEKALSIQNLENADEIFLTNAVAGLKHVEKFNDKIYSNSVAKLLNELLNNSV